MNLDIDSMSLEEIKSTVKMLVRCHNDLHDIVIILQDRIIELEMKYK